MALNIATLVARVVADTAGFNAGMAGVEGRLTGVSSSFQRTGGMLTRSLTIPILAAAGASVKFGIDFQREMEKIHTQAGASQNEVEKMSKAVLDLAPSTTFGPTKLAEALYHIESVGARGAAAMNVLKVAAQGAAVGGSNLEDTASALAGTMRVYHVAASGAAGIMGELNAIVGAGNMRMQDLNNAISTGLLPTASGLGIGLKEIGAAMATMTDESVPAQVAATRLRTLLLLMTGETKKSVTTLEHLGIKSGELGAKMREPGGMIPALEDLRAHLDHLNKTDQVKVLAQAFGGARSAGTIIQLLNNLGMVHQKLDQINKTAGNFPEDVLRTTQTESFKLHEAWAAIQTVMTRVGEILAPVVSAIASEIAKLLGAFSHLSKPIQDIIIYGALAAAALGPLLWVVGSLIGVFAMIATPVGATVAGLMALGAAGIYLNNHVSAVHDAFKGFTDFLGLTHPTFTQGVTDFGHMSDSASRQAEVAKALGSVWQASLPAIHSVVQTLQRIWADVSTFAIQEFDKMKNGIMAHSQEIRAFLSTAWNAIVAIFHAVMPIIKREVEIAWAAIKVIIDTAMKVIGNVILAVMDVISGNWSGAWHAIERATGALLSGIVSLIGIYLHRAVPLALHVAEAIGMAIAEGIFKVAVFLLELPGKIQGAIASAVIAVAGWAVGEAASIGHALVQGIESGIGSLAGGIADRLKGAVSGALGSVKGMFGIHSPSTVTRDQIGKPLGEGVIIGYIMGSGSLPSKMKESVRKAIEAAKQEVQNAQSVLSTAFTRLSDYAFRAFDAVTSKHLAQMQTTFDAKIKKMVTDPLAKAQAALDKKHDEMKASIDDKFSAPTPTELLVNTLEENKRQDDMQKALRDSLDKVHDAQQALTDLQAAGNTATEEQLKDANKNLLDANTAYHDAQYAIALDALQKQAAVERKAADDQKKIAQDAADDLYKQQQDALNARYDALQKKLTDQYNQQVLNYQSERDLQKQHLQDMLDAMEKSLEKHPQLWQKYHDIIMAKFKTAFGPDYKAAGKLLGDGFAEGLREAQAGVKAAATSLATTVSKILKLHSPAEEGPMSDLNTWWRPMTATLLGGLTPDALQRGVEAYTPTPGAATYGGGSGSGDTIIQVSVPNATFLSGDRRAAREFADMVAPFINDQITIRT